MPALTDLEQFYVVEGTTAANTPSTTGSVTSAAQPVSYSKAAAFFSAIGDVADFYIFVLLIINLILTAIVLWKLFGGSK